MFTMKTMILLITAMLCFRITQAAEGQYWYNCSCGNSDAEVFKNLYEDGCCSDRIECPSHHTPKYLGVDVFMRIWGDRYVYLLFVHQQNFLLTWLFESSLKIRETHTGHFNHSTSAFKRSFTSYCPQNQDVSKLVTGFSVELPGPSADSSLWYSYIVCGEDVLVRERPQNYTPGDSISFTRHNTTSACAIHPVFCPPKGKDYPLISIAVIPTKTRDKNPYIYGYYAEKRQTEDREKREYVVKAWRWKYNEDKKPNYERKFYGYLTEIDTYNETNTEMLGIYFTVDGNACFFKQEFSDPPKLDIEDLEVPRKPCLSFQVFIGCPTPWCFDVKIDASFSYTETNPENKDETEFKVVVFKGFFYWILEDIGLPFDVPSYKYAYKIFNTGREWSPVCQRYTGFQNAPVCLTPSVDAAFGGNVSGQQLIYTRDSNRNDSTINPVGDHANNNYDQTDPITRKHGSNIGAALFDQDSETAYLFTWNTYEAYKYDSVNKIWNLVPDKSGKLSESNIEFDNVDAGVNLRDNKAYIFSDNWYMEIIFSAGKLKAKEDKLVGIEKFFDIRKECYYNNQDEYFELLSRYLGENRTAASEPGNVHARPEELNPTKERKSMVVYIILILLCGAVIIFCIWVAMFVYDRRSRSGQVLSRSKAYHGKKAGKMGSRMGPSPKRRSHH